MDGQFTAVTSAFDMHVTWTQHNVQYYTLIHREGCQWSLRSENIC